MAQFGPVYFDGDFWGDSYWGVDADPVGRPARYFADTYWGTGYWGANYWDTEDVTATAEYFGSEYWGSAYFGDAFWGQVQNLPEYAGRFAAFGIAASALSGASVASAVLAADSVATCAAVAFVGASGALAAPGTGTTNIRGAATTQITLASTAGASSSLVGGNAQGRLVLSWVASTDPGVTGYYVAWDTVSHDGSTSTAYAQVRDVGNVTTYTITGLIEGQRYYVGLSSHGIGGHDAYESLVVEINALPYAQNQGALFSTASATSSFAGGLILPAALSDAGAAVGSFVGSAVTAAQLDTVAAATSEFGGDSVDQEQAVLVSVASATTAAVGSSVVAADMATTATATSAFESAYCLAVALDAAGTATADLVGEDGLQPCDLSSSGTATSTFVGGTIVSAAMVSTSAANAEFFDPSYVPPKKQAAGGKRRRPRTYIAPEDERLLTDEQREALGLPRKQAEDETQQPKPQPKRARRTGKASRGIQLAPEPDIEAQRAAEILAQRTAELMAQQQAAQDAIRAEGMAMLQAAAQIEAENEILMLLLMAA